MSFIIPPPAPKEVLQSGEETCWAAALECWLDRVADVRRRRTQTELLATGGGKGLDYGGFRWLAASLGMTTQEVGIEALAPEAVEERLRKRGVLFVAFPTTEPVGRLGAPVEKPWWHDVVLYGVTTASATRRGAPARYHVMDPGKGKRTDQWRLEQFLPLGLDRRALLGWKNPHGPGEVL